MIEGEPALVRTRSDLPSAEDCALFRNLVVATWTYPASDANGFPPADMLDRMDTFETALFTACERDRWWGCDVAVITRAGQREWRFYTPDTRAFMAEFNTALDGQNPFPINLTVYDDPDWQALRELQA